jgi:nitrile hydratase subunit beta
MPGNLDPVEPSPLGVVLATGEVPLFRAGDPVRVLTRSPVGHCRVPVYLRGKSGSIESRMTRPWPRPRS